MTKAIVRWIVDQSSFSTHTAEKYDAFYKRALSPHGITIEFMDLKQGYELACGPHAARFVVAVSDFSRRVYNHQLLKLLVEIFALRGFQSISHPNAGSGINTSSKLSTSYWLTTHGLAAIPTYPCIPGIEDATWHVDFPVVLKPDGLAMGIGVMKLYDEDSLVGAIEHISRSGTAYVLQPAIKVVREFRVFVDAGGLLGVTTKVPNKSGFLTNLSAKGEMASSDWPDTVAQSTIEIAKRIGRGFIAVDWFEDEEGSLYVNEIEGALAGFSGADLATRDQIARSFAHQVLQKL